MEKQGKDINPAAGPCRLHQHAIDTEISIPPEEFRKSQVIADGKTNGESVTGADRKAISGCIVHILFCKPEEVGLCIPGMDRAVGSGQEGQYC